MYKESLNARSSDIYKYHMSCHFIQWIFTSRTEDRCGAGVAGEKLCSTTSWWLSPLTPESKRQRTGIFSTSCDSTCCVTRFDSTKDILLPLCFLILGPLLYWTDLLYNSGTLAVVDLHWMLCYRLLQGYYMLHMGLHPSQQFSIAALGL